MPAGGGSFLTWDAPNLEMVTLKEAEDGDGFILRFREIAGRGGETAVKLPTFRVGEARLCNGVEDNQQKLVVSRDTVEVPYKPWAFTTVRLKSAKPTIRGSSR